MTPPELALADDLPRWLEAVHQWLLARDGAGGLSTAAAQAGMSRSHLTNLLSGRRQVLPHHVAPLAAAIGLDARQTEALAARVSGRVASATAAPGEQPEGPDDVSENRALLRGAAPGDWAVRAWIWTLPVLDATRVFAAGRAAISSGTPVQSSRPIRVFLRAFPVTSFFEESSMEARFSSASSLTHPPAGATVHFNMKHAPANEEAPDILDFLDYRDFLLRYLDAARARNRRLSTRWLGQRLGVSAGQASNVLARRRNLDPATAARHAGGLGLVGDRADYLTLLIDYNDSADALSALQAWRRICLVRARHGRTLQQEARSVLLMRWYVPVVLELSLQPGWREDPAWIAARVRPDITPEQAQGALSLLRAAGLLGGASAEAAPVVRAPRYLADELLLRFHDECLDVAAATAALGLSPWQLARLDVDAPSGGPTAVLQRWHAAVEAAARAVPTPGAPAHLFLAHATRLPPPPP